MKEVGGMEGFIQFVEKIRNFTAIHDYCFHHLLALFLALKIVKNHPHFIDTLFSLAFFLIAFLCIILKNVDCEFATGIYAWISVLVRFTSVHLKMNFPISYFFSERKKIVLYLAFRNQSTVSRRPLTFIFLFALSFPLHCTCNLSFW